MPGTLAKRLLPPRNRHTHCQPITQPLPTECITIRIYQPRLAIAFKLSLILTSTAS